MPTILSKAIPNLRAPTHLASLRTWSIARKRVISPGTLTPTTVLRARAGNTKQPVQPHHMLEDCKQGGALTLHVKTMPAEFEHVWQDTDVVGKNGAELKILRKAIDVKVLQMYEVHVENLSLQECLFDALKEVTKVCAAR